MTFYLSAGGHRRRDILARRGFPGSAVSARTRGCCLTRKGPKRAALDLDSRIATDSYAAGSHRSPGVPVPFRHWPTAGQKRRGKWAHEPHSG
jgi:hypothetical protein